MLLVDIAVGTLRRVPLAGLPLLTVYSVPVSLLGGGVSWIIFTLTTIGFLVMLYLQESRQIARWGRPLGQDVGSDPSGFGVSNGALRSSAGAIGGVATALAIVIPLFVPTFGLQLFGNGFGPGDGDQVKIVNPMTDLKRDLTRGKDVDMITVTTDDPDPSYLRIAVLNRFSDNEWTSGDRKAPTDQRAFGQLPSISGLSSSVPRKEYNYDVDVGQSFSSTWLPTAAPISRIDAAGDWRYDLSTMDFMAFDDSTNAKGEHYTMTSVEPDLDPLALNVANASTDLAGTQFTDLPDGLPTIVTRDALEVTSELPTKYQKAVALQDWFRDNFDYSLATRAGQRHRRPRGVPHRGQGRARRVLRAVRLRDGGDGAHPQHPRAGGRGLPQADGGRTAQGDDKSKTWVYSAWDMHAWPELFFPGAGWVRFEPTPATRSGETTAPAYTNLPVRERADRTCPAPAPPRGTSTGPPLPATPRSRTRRTRPAPAAAASRSRGAALLIGGGVLAVLVALTFVPRLVRRRRREGRLGEGPEPVWIELRDSVVDLGLTWPTGRSPRETGSYLVHYFGRPPGEDTATRPRHGVDVSPEAETALSRIVSTIEHERYAPPGRDQAAILKADAETVIEALVGGVPARARRRAEWLPKSLLVSRRRPVSTSSSGEDETRYGGVVDHVGG